MARLPGASKAPPTPCSTRIPMRTCGIGRQPATRRRQGEPGHADLEQPSASVAVAQGAAYEQQGRQRQHVAGHHPLERGDARVKVTTDHREGDADDRRIDGGDARPEHTRCDDPTARRRRE